MNEDVNPLAGTLSARMGDIPPERAAEVTGYAVTLAADWLGEAGHNEHSASVLALLKSDFDDALADLGAADRIAVLQGQATERRVRRLGVRSFALGCSVVDAATDSAAASEEGQAVLAEVTELRAAVQALADESLRRRLERELGEAMLEGLYAVEGKAMSLRLGRYASGKGLANPTAR